MLDQVCTPDTARRLKEKGFPQPVLSFGQIWYDNSGNKVIMGDADSITGLNYGLNNGVMYGGKANELLTYAPTAPDILRQLGVLWDLFYRPVEDMYNIAAHGELYIDTNPAEACAHAWEAQN